MTKRYYALKDYWFDLDTGEIENRPGKFHAPREISRARSQKLHTPQIMIDATARNPYRPPTGTGEYIDSRQKQSEALKKHNCRIREPSEFKPQYNNKKFAQRHGLPHTSRD